MNQSPILCLWSRLPTSRKYGDRRSEGQARQQLGDRHGVVLRHAKTCLGRRVKYSFVTLEADLIMQHSMHLWRMILCSRILFYYEIKKERCRRWWGEGKAIKTLSKFFHSFSVWKDSTRKGHLTEENSRLRNVGLSFLQFAVTSHEQWAYF